MAFYRLQIQAPNDTAKNNEVLTLNQKTRDFISTMQIQQSTSREPLYRIQMSKS